MICNLKIKILQEKISLLSSLYLQITKSWIILIFYHFYVKNILYHCCTKAKDQFEPSRREIHSSVSLKHGRGMAGHTPFQKVKRNTDSSSWTHFQLLCQILWNLRMFDPTPSCHTNKWTKHKPLLIVCTKYTYDYHNFYKQWNCIHYKK